MNSTRWPLTSRLALFAGAGLLFTACSAEQAPTGLDLDPSFNLEDGELPSEVTLCKIGPEDSWADFSLEADGGTLTQGDALRLDAALSLEDTPGDGCATIWKTAEGDPDVVSLTVTETDMTAGTEIDRIVVQGGLDGGFELDGTHNSVTVRLDATTGAQVYFKNVGTPDEPGGEGCTPGYWRQPHHFDNWTAPYAPDTPFASVFDDAFPGETLLDAVWLRGGGLNALGRHAVAALLNAASPDVDYGMTTDDVISAFNAAFASGDYEAQKDAFEGLNESGCDLD